MVWGRLTAKRYGVELADVRTETGLISSVLWAEIARRDRARMLDVWANYLPAMVYAMSGAPDHIEYADRHKMLAPALRSLRASLLGIGRTTRYRKAELTQTLAHLQAQQRELAHLEWLTGDTFSFDQWLSAGDQSNQE